MKNVLATLLGLIFPLILVTPAFAAGGIPVNPCPSGSTGGSNFSGLCNLDASKIGTIILTTVTVLLIAAALIALFFLIWGGIRWITSGGDKAKVQGARDTIIASIIGLIIAFLAFFILQVVLGFFGLDIRTFKLPTIV